MSQEISSQKISRVPLIGGILAALGASLCCLGPLVLLLLGVSGSWIGSLGAFAPYRPLFVGVMVIALVMAGWRVYRPDAFCEPGAVCSIPAVRRRQRRLFWLVTIIALVLVTSDYWIVLVA